MNSKIKSSNSLKVSVIASCIAAIFNTSVHASAVRNDVDYQMFRDFAENKGKFRIGEMNIPVVDKDGKSLGTMLKDIPMIDFSAANRSGYATLVHPQYVVSVAHNQGYGSSSFGHPGDHLDIKHYNYELVDRNNYTKAANLGYWSEDYHLPRLAKLVTEVVPQAVSELKVDTAIYQDRTRFPLFIRMGSGMQATRNSDGKTSTHGWYDMYLTGGGALNVGGNNLRQHGFIDGSGSLFDGENGPMLSYGMPGDSGSGLYGYDTVLKKWVFVGTLVYNYGDDGHTNTWNIVRPDFHKIVVAEDVVDNITTTSATTLNWTPKGNTSHIIGGDIDREVKLRDETVTADDKSTTRPSMNHGQTVTLGGAGGSLVLGEDIHQGAGALYFDSDFTVSGKNDTTSWIGAGISVAKDKTVTWQVRNPEKDRLSKIGEGTLVVNGKGENKGEISVGDGVVKLNQQADANGKVQAFSEVGIVSGRPTVVLGDDKQVAADNIYFGYRGGRLDINGNNLTFTHIRNVDDGARIVNHNQTTASTVNITGNAALTDATLKQGTTDMPANQPFNKDLYLWWDWDWRANYFLPREGRTYPYHSVPENHTSNDYWEFIGYDGAAARKIAIERANNGYHRITAFNGYLGEMDKDKPNGELNVNYKPLMDNGLLLLSGGTNLNGTLSAENGSILLSGRPTPYARAYQQFTEIVHDNDWMNRTFNATTIAAKNDGKIHIGRNVTAVNANFTATDNAALNLGFIDGSTPVCIRSDYQGSTTCNTPTLTTDVHQTVPVTDIRGNATLTGASLLALGKANLTGYIQADTTTRMTMSNHSSWTMTADSTLGNLAMEDGANITLNTAQDPKNINKYNTLTIGGNLSGQGLFNYLSDMANLVSDKVIVNGMSSGSHKLFVNDTGVEPNHVQPLSLFTTAGGEQDFSITLANPNQRVDLGAYRYTLEKYDNTYYLHNPTRVLTAKGESVKADVLPELHFGHGDNLTNEGTPTLEFAHGETLLNDEKPTLELGHGETLLNDEKPTLELGHGETLVNDEKPTLELVHGETLVNDEKPTLELARGETLVNDENPTLELAHGETLVNDEKPTLELAHSETLANDEKPTLELAHSETLANDEKPTLELAHSETLANDEKPTLELAHSETLA
ncbi:hypothetical protein A1D22_05555, partial [Pasteurellaceae bacterium LFhippo2]|nr:hypothetical protein [Pasteurellaceae bacterium LFhippo2]